VVGVTAVDMGMMAEGLTYSFAICDGGLTSCGDPDEKQHFTWRVRPVLLTQNIKFATQIVNSLGRSAAMILMIEPVACGLVTFNPIIARVRLRELAAGVVDERSARQS